MNANHPCFADAHVCLNFYGTKPKVDPCLPLSLAVIESPAAVRDEDSLKWALMWGGLLNDWCSCSRRLVFAVEEQTGHRHYHGLLMQAGMKVVVWPDKPYVDINLPALARWRDHMRGKALKIDMRAIDALSTRNVSGNEDGGAVYVDLSHVSEARAIALLKEIERNGHKPKPIITHTGMARVYNHPRNVCDEVAGRVVALGGVVCLTTRVYHLTSDGAEIDPFLKHLECALKLCGVEHVGIGSGGIYADMNFTDERGVHTQKFWEVKEWYDLTYTKKRTCSGLQMRFPDQPERLYVRDRMTVLHEVIAKEFGPEIANAVCGENLIRFFS